MEVVVGFEVGESESSEDPRDVLLTVNVCSDMRE
jgi:hypothetical protein